jgi:hypothetical protein
LRGNYRPLIMAVTAVTLAWRKKQLNVHAQRFDFRT